MTSTSLRIQGTASDLTRLAGWIATHTLGRTEPYIFGVSGAQGSGKTTLCGKLSALLSRAEGWFDGAPLNVLTLSIDDLYLTRAERLALAAREHPLCAIRGLPGTHDVALGLRLLDALATAAPADVTHVPRFDKAADDRVPPAQFDQVHGRPDVILFEGWCVAATPGPAWAGPINTREARDDPDGRWARWSEAALADDYQELWARIHGLLFIEAPSFEAVVAGRWRQEQRLAERLAQAAMGASGDAPSRPVGLMTEAEVRDYVALFERKTRQMLADLPARADWIADHWISRPAAPGCAC